MSRLRLAILLPLAIYSCSASASVIYSGLQNIAIPTNFDGVYLDVDAGTTATVEFTGWDVNPFFGGTGVANSPSFQPVRTGTGNEDPIIRLNVGDTIDATRFFSSGYGGSDSHLGNGSNQFGNGQEGYLGFKLTTNANAGPYFGWMRVVFTANTSGAFIRDWAYETTASSTVAGRILESAPSAGVQTVTLSGGTGETYTLGSTLADHDGNATAVVKTGAGQWTFDSAHTYTGATTINGGVLNAAAAGALGSTSSVVVNTGGTLLLSGAPGDRIGNASAITLNANSSSAAALSTSGLAETVGALTLSSNSVLDLGTLNGGNALTFADSSANAWTGTLSIWNWSGSGSGGGLDQVIFANTSSDGTALTAAQLGQISFFSDAGMTSLGTAQFVSGNFGEIVPVPEPASVLGALALAGLIGYRERRYLPFTRAAHRA